MFKKLLISAMVFSSVLAMAHEGHDQTPGMLKANHGGIVKPGKQVNLEYVVSGEQVKMYPVSHEGKDLGSTEVTVSATAKSPKSKAESLNIEYKDGAFVTQVDFKGAYRSELNVVVDEKGKSSQFKFQVEK